jgi:hypothetical protein
MAQLAERDQGLDFVETSVNYVVDRGEKPVTHISRPGVRGNKHEAEYEAHTVAIHNARSLAAQPSLDREGFALTRHETKVTDFFDQEQLRSIYDEEAERLVKKFSGAKRVFVFDHTIRTSTEATRTEKSLRAPVRLAHNDYTERSGPQRVRDLMPADEVEGLLDRRFAVIQLWRPIRETVRQMPLAICDAQSIAPRDLIATDLKYQDRTGEVYQLAYNPDHRWFYLPEMARNEVLVLKCYDSLTDGRARFTAHTAFEDPTSSPDAAPRESIETRTLAFF